MWEAKKKNMRIKKGKEKGRWQEAIIGIALAAIMLASIFAAMIPMVSADSRGDNFNYIVKQQTPQKVLIGQNLQFEGFTNIAVVYRLVGGDIENTYTADANNRIYNVNWPTSGEYYVDYEGPDETQLSVEDLNMPLELKIGTKGVSSIAVGTHLTVDTGGMNLFPEDRVDLVIIGPDGQIKYDAINDQLFTDISVSDLCKYRDGGLKTYGWVYGDYTFAVKTKSAYACGLDAMSWIRPLKIIKGVITIEAEWTCTVELDTVKLTVAGVAYDEIKVEASPLSRHVIFKAGIDDTPLDVADHPSWFNDVIDADGIRKYAVEFTDTGTYTMKVTVTAGERAGDSDAVYITVLEKEVMFDMPDVVVIGERIMIQGTATSGTYVSVYVNDTLHPKLTNIVLEDGEFNKEVKTTEVGMVVPGSVRLKAWINCEKAAGEERPTRSSDGEDAILLTTPELMTELSVSNVALEDDFTVLGIAKGQQEVTILSVPPEGGGGKSLLDKGQKGLSLRKASVSMTDDTYSKKMTVQEDADLGYYDIYVLGTGMDGEWGITGEENLEAALDAGYNITSLTRGIINTMTQEEIHDIVTDLVNTAGSDDLMWEGWLKVEMPYVWLEPIAAVAVGEPLVVTGTSSRQEGFVIVVTCKGPVELEPKVVKIENGAFWCVFDTTDVTTGKYIVEVDDGDGHTDTVTVEILASSPPAPEASVLSLLHCDITGDSINDILVLSYTVDPATGEHTILSDIEAVNGSNGETLWNKSFEDCLAVTLSAGDLNGDNKTDIVINLMYIDPISRGSSAKVIGVNGCNGVELWNKSKTGAKYEVVVMIGVPTNLTSTNRTDVVISTLTLSEYFEKPPKRSWYYPKEYSVWNENKGKSKYSSLYGSRTEITAINGSDGSELWEKSFTDSLVFGVPVDLSNDGKDEVVIGMPEEGMNTTTPDVIAINGSNGIEIWSNHYPDVATFSPADDLTGDGATDLTVRIGCCRIDAVRGYDGTRLWTKEV
ncbi:hypothetical protein C4E24_04490 [ANME-1 cluster archaeon AG-394-G21]|nr:hypothetical protein [ANME-1 cluster archaeon AG-394-G21]